MFLRHRVPWTYIDIQVKFYGDRPRGTPPLGELNTLYRAATDDGLRLHLYCPSAVRLLAPCSRSVMNVFHSVLTGTDLTSMSSVDKSDRRIVHSGRRKMSDSDTEQGKITGVGRG